jgi:hypothetical protein
VEPSHSGGTKRKPSPVLVAVTALLLIGYFGLVGWAWTGTATDPQHGMAGFLMMVTLFFLCLAGALWYGASRQRSGCVWFVFVICALPSLSLVGRAIYLLVRWLKQGS